MKMSIRQQEFHVHQKKFLEKIPSEIINEKAGKNQLRTVLHKSVS